MSAMPLLDRLEVPSAGLELRPYQTESCRRVMSRFEAGDRSTLLVLATGTGKTVVFGAIARRVIDDGGRVLVLAHRNELLTQAANILAAVGLDSAIEKADQVARAGAWGDPDCVVASVQTMQRKRLESWPAKHFKLVVTDEAHHATSKSYRSVIRHLDPDWHLGVTATADRLDGENLGQVYQSMAHEYSLREAISDKFLVPLKIVRCETTVNLDDIRTTAGDLNQGDLEDAIAPHIEELANAIRQEIGQRRTIVFTPDVGSGQAMASALSSLGLEAESVSGESKDRDEVFDRFRRGRSRVLVNCMLCTEGFDAPFVSAVVLARPTKSRSLYSQMVGRGTRLSPGKSDCIVVDFAWLTSRHDLVKPTELFDTTGQDAAIQELAAALIDAGETDDLMEAIERAEKTHHERQRLRIRAREREARYRRVEYNPFAVMDTLGLPSRRESESSLKVLATAPQVAFLESKGVTDARSMSRRRASMMIDVLIRRQNARLATLKQVSWCINKGMDPDEARKLSFSDASSFLDSCFKSNR